MDEINLSELFAAVKRDGQDVTEQAALVLEDRDQLNMRENQWQQYLLVLSDDVRRAVFKQRPSGRQPDNAPSQLPVKVLNAVHKFEVAASSLGSWR